VPSDFDLGALDLITFGLSFDCERHEELIL